MKYEKEYVEHVKECLTFAHRITDAALGQSDEMRNELFFLIFEKICTPFYYFLQNSENGEPSSQLPTEKQIAYALQLGIQEPETFSKQQLSEEIDKVLKRSRGIK